MCFCCEVASRFSRSANQRTASRVSRVRGREGDDPDIFGGKIISVLIFGGSGRVLLIENKVVDFSAISERIRC